MSSARGGWERERESGEGEMEKALGEKEREKYCRSFSAGYSEFSQTQKWQEGRRARRAEEEARKSERQARGEWNWKPPKYWLGRYGRGFLPYID